MIVGRRLLAWALTLPVAAIGILGAHAVAYRATGTALGSTHAYLDHAPQVLAILVLIGVCVLAGQTRGGTPSRRPFALLSLVGFVAQEHVERLAHTGSLPFLIDDRAFLLGLVLQVPVALLCVWIVRFLVVTLRAPVRRRPPRLPRLTLELSTLLVGPCPAPAPVARRGRAPPRRLHR